MLSEEAKTALALADPAVAREPAQLVTAADPGPLEGQPLAEPVEEEGVVQFNPFSDSALQAADGVPPREVPPLQRESYHRRRQPLFHRVVITRRPSSPVTTS